MTLQCWHPLAIFLRRKSKLYQNPSSARLHYCWRNSSFRYVTRCMCTVRYWYCAVLWGIRFAEFGVEFCEIRQNLKIHHPLKKFQIWWIRSDLDDLRSLLGSDHLIIGTNPLVSSQQLAECWVYWENAGELKEYLIFTAPECFANISLYAVSSHLLTQITDCERMFSTITRTANRTPQ